MTVIAEGEIFRIIRGFKRSSNFTAIQCSYELAMAGFRIGCGVHMAGNTLYDAVWVRIIKRAVNRPISRRCVTSSTEACIVWGCAQTARDREHNKSGCQK